MSKTCAQWDENINATVKNQSRTDICTISNGHPAPQNKVTLVFKSCIYLTVLYAIKTNNKKHLKSPWGNQTHPKDKIKVKNSNTDFFLKGISVAAEMCTE